MTKTKLLGESNKRTKLKVEISFDTPEHAEEAAFIFSRISNAFKQLGNSIGKVNSK